MSEEANKKLANEVYNTLCRALDNLFFEYTKEEGNIVQFCVNGDDVTIHILIVVEEKSQVIRLLSMMPFFMSEEKRVDGAIAACIATNDCIAGNFDYSIENGTVVFRMTSSFHESTIGEGLFQHMISYASDMVGKYNDVFLGIEKGAISIEELIEQVQ